MSTSYRSATLFLGAGALLGILAVGAMRYANLPAQVTDEGVHYHANFTVFVDGERLDLSDERYMEDIATCKANPDIVLPRERAHLHERIGDIVHVHQPGVTWGHLFANIGFVLGDGVLVTDDGRTFIDDGTRTMTFVLNGQTERSVYNLAIASEDRLLISIGDATPDSVLNAQFAEVPATAAAFNGVHQDAGGCSASAPVEVTPGERIRRAFWF
jgi:hypothetical protein